MVAPIAAKIEEFNLTDSAIAEYLSQVRDFLAETDWCQLAGARNQAGQAVKILSPTATSFCLGGAVDIVLQGSEVGELVKRQITGFLENTENFHGSFIYYNDMKGRTKTDVLELLDRMIKQYAEAVK